MHEPVLSSKQKNSIPLSRNKPISLVVGAAGFIGSHIVDYLLEKDIQVIGVDNFSLGKNKNLEIASRDKNFHLIHEDIAYENVQNLLHENLPRLDYIFFVTSNEKSNNCYAKGLRNLFEALEKLANNERHNGSLAKTKIVFVSSAELYGEIEKKQQKELKSAEVFFAKKVKELSLNARVVRLADVYGPRMHFREKSPMSKLIFAKIENALQKSPITDEYSSRALFIDDAVSLIVKALLSSGTVNKIYDGVEPKPYKVSEIRDLLLDPKWHAQKGFKPTEIPPWTTPNLKKTTTELSWKPKTDLVSGLVKTLDFFSQFDEKELAAYIAIEDKEEEKPKEIKEPVQEKKALAVHTPIISKTWSFGSTEKMEQESKFSFMEKKSGRFSAFAHFFIFLFLTGLIVYAFFLPPFFIVFSSFSLKQHISAAVNYMQVANFEESRKQLGFARNDFNRVKDNENSITAISDFGLFARELNSFNDLLSLEDQGIKTVTQAVDGFNYLKEGIDSFVNDQDIKERKDSFSKADYYLNLASENESYLQARFADDSLFENLPEMLKQNAGEMGSQIKKLEGVIRGSREVTRLLLPLTTTGNKTFVVAYLNDQVLESIGGRVDGIFLLKIENGKLTIDAKNYQDLLKNQQVQPPSDIASDFKNENIPVTDSGFDPDFPTFANEIQGFMNANGEKIDGVLALNNEVLQKLSELSSEGKGESDSKNSASLENNEELLSQMISSLQTLQKEKWLETMQVFEGSLESKNAQLFFEDPALEDISSQNNWDGAFSVIDHFDEGESRDGISYYATDLTNTVSKLETKEQIETTINEDGEVTDMLSLTFNNASNGEYKKRIRIYLPLGAKILQASLNGTDVQNNLSVFVEHDQTVYSQLITFPQNSSAILKLTYQLPKAIIFKDGKNNYHMKVTKQSGAENIPVTWSLVVPQLLKISTPEKFDSSKQISESLVNTISMQVTLSK